LSKKVSAIDVHLGYAPALMEAGNRQLDGIFYGVDYRPCRWINLMGEYDTRYFNAGARLNCGKHLSFNAGLINGDSFAGGVNYRLLLSTN
jgi:hypothetical protein